MLDVLKRVEKLRRDAGGGKGNSLEPPTNLPDLARDMYERDQQKTAYMNTSLQTPSSVITTTHASFTPVSKVVNEPNKDSVPGLDLSLVRQHLNASQSAIQSVPSQPTQSSIQHQTPQSAQQSIQQPVQQPIISQSTSQPMFLDNNNNTVDDSTGFFKEFEEYIKNNGLSNDIVDELLDKNLLDHMMFYHTIKGEDMPFYASSAELSHAIKVKLEDLQNLERNWISNKQKMDLMKKWSSTIESDIHLRSEELKKMMTESRKRGNVIKSTDFFQIVKPKTVAPVHAYTYAENVVDTHVNTSPSSKIVSSIPYFIPQQSSTALTYALNNYIITDPSKYFYAIDGQIFKSLLDLMNGLEIMDKNTFNHHVNDSKNDFSNWIKGVFGDFRLSDSIRSLVDRENLWYFLKNNTY